MRNSPAPGAPLPEELVEHDPRRAERRSVYGPQRSEAHRRAASDARRKRRARRQPFVRLSIALVSRLPLAVAAVLGELAGRLGFLLVRAKRKRTIDHVHLAYGDEKTPRERRKIARRSFALAGRGMGSLLVLARMPHEKSHARLSIEGREHLDKALENGKGCIWIAYHYGLFELMGGWLSVNYGGCAVGAEVKSGGGTAELIRLREALGNPTIQQGEARTLMRTLKSNRPVGMMLDHDVSDVRGVFVPFFGHLAHTAVGPAVLALRTGAALVPVFTQWTGLTTSRLRIYPPIEPDESLPKAERVHDLMYRITQFGEERIRDKPDHWLWLHRRWRTRPEQRPELPVYTGRPG